MGGGLVGRLTARYRAISRAALVEISPNSG